MSEKRKCYNKFSRIIIVMEIITNNTMELFNQTNFYKCVILIIGSVDLFSCVFTVAHSKKIIKFLKHFE